MLDPHARPALADPGDPGRRGAGLGVIGRGGGAAGPGGRQVELLDVVRDHASGRDAGPQGGERVAHHGQPLMGDAVRPVVADLAVEPGRHVVLDQLVERCGLDAVPLIVGGPVVGGRDRPAVLAVVELVPPAVEHREIEPAVDRGLHPGGAAGLERSQGVVEPDVAAREQGARHRHVVVRQEHDAVADLGVVGEAHQVLDHALAHLVGRVGLAGDHELDGAHGVQQQALEALRIAQHQGQALVGGHPSGEADREDLRIEHRVGPAQLGISGAALLPRRAQATTDIGHQIRAHLGAHAPQLLVRDLGHSPPARAQIRLRPVHGQGLHARIDPGRHVHAVGHRRDGDLVGVEAVPQPGEHLPRHRAVQLGHAVGPLGQAQAHDGHVEPAAVAAVVVLAPQSQDLLERGGPGQLGGEEALDHLALEAVDAGRDRGVRGEHSRGAHRGEGLEPGHAPAAVGAGAHQLGDALDSGEARVALVAVEDLRVGGAGEP